ncbi:MAG: Deoxyribose-phosphate aldolase 1 [candidate division WS2 bacterium]|uniref:Deoxyribose-phosphate aldolase n=1 Tax=Psychracetigena formicireducens TaxID=2986056 RepID=A0A9E2F3R9_PSYF1|nr:Deoxyribose-phosphate aldolase 1 [Candidatus Psychracetigena formicireducens]MBT9144191.1 Deoxyribose-phosphate aldolase 1 [Candidatus Psychracetigena formicireducens]MBT9149969.1 Deoxyribose-phosphate aldolase 1 [Candidatus Psychracetigena formicireducens]
MMTPKELSLFFDHTLLKPDASKEDIEILCQQGINYNFYSLCVHPCYVPMVSSILKSSQVKICSVVGFPLGANLLETKVGETEALIKAGCDEIDMVINIGFFKDKNYSYLKNEIKNIRNVSIGHILKVIIETCYLNREEMREIVNLLIEEGADFVKTSTGFGPGGATIDDINFLLTISSPHLKVKASGGIRSLDDALSYIKAGIHRIGSSSSHKIVDEYITRINYANK